MVAIRQWHQLDRLRASARACLAVIEALDAGARWAATLWRCVQAVTRNQVGRSGTKYGVSTGQRPARLIRFRWRHNLSKAHRTAPLRGRRTGAPRSGTGTRPEPSHTVLSEVAMPNTGSVLGMRRGEAAARKEPDGGSGQDLRMAIAAG